MTDPEANPRMPSGRRRRPWIAAVSCFVALPLGYMYVGRLGRGIALSVALLLSTIAMLWSAVRTAEIGFLAAGIAISVGGLLALSADAFRLARGSPQPFPLRRYNRWWAYAIAIVLASVTVEWVQSTIRERIGRAFRIPSEAMSPALVAGDHILVELGLLAARDLRRFDIVVFDYPPNPEKLFVMRIIALPGETVEIRARQVWIDGQPLAEPHAPAAPGEALDPRRHERGPREIPAGHYFVLGDNRDRSYDSRFWGDVPADAIRGRVRFVYFSWPPADPAPRWDRIGLRFE